MFRKKGVGRSVSMPLQVKVGRQNLFYVASGTSVFNEGEIKTEMLKICLEFRWRILAKGPQFKILKYLFSMQLLE